MGDTSSPPSEKPAILSTIKSLLSSTFNKPPPYPSAHAILIHPSGKVTTTTFSALLTDLEDRLTKLYTTGVKSIEQVLLEDPGTEPDVWVGGRLAAVWFNFIVRVDRVEKYRGVAAYTLFKRDEGWKVGAITEKRWMAGEPAPTPFVREVSGDMMEPNLVLCKLLNEEKWDEVGELMLPGGGAMYMRYPNTLLMLQWDEFFSRMREMLGRAKPGYVHQELMDWEGWVCGDFGLVWTPFTVALDGEVRIRGFNAFTMIKTGGEVAY